MRLSQVSHRIRSRTEVGTSLRNSGSIDIPPDSVQPTYEMEIMPHSDIRRLGEFQRFRREGIERCLFPGWSGLPAFC